MLLKDLVMDGLSALGMIPTLTPYGGLRHTAAKPSVDLFQQKIFSLAVGNEFLQPESLECEQILYFEVAVAEHIFHNKLMFFSKIDEAILLASAKNVK